MPGGLQSIKDQEPNLDRVSSSSNHSAPGGFNGYRRQGSLNTLSATSYTRGVMHQQAATRVSVNGLNGGSCYA